MPEVLDFNMLDEIINKHRGEGGALIPILQEVQRILGYLPEDPLVRISRELKIPLCRIYGVLTFYAQFHLTPRGWHIVRVCQGTACHVRGGRSILNAVKNHLAIEVGETTKDFNFSLETVACLGTCFLAPVMMVDRNYYGKLIPQRVLAILHQFTK